MTLRTLFPNHKQKEIDKTEGAELVAEKEMAGKSIELIITMHLVYMVKGN